LCLKVQNTLLRSHPSTDIDDCDQQSRDISVRQGVVDQRWFPGSWAGDQPVFNTPELFNLARPEGFEPPTAGFEDQNSSTELRTDVWCSQQELNLCFALTKGM
jgi:hypothetical protein